MKNCINLADNVKILASNVPVLAHRTSDQPARNENNYYLSAGKFCSRLPAASISGYGQFFDISRCTVARFVCPLHQFSQNPDLDDLPSLDVHDVYHIIRGSDKCRGPSLSNSVLHRTPENTLARQSCL